LAKLGHDKTQNQHQQNHLTQASLLVNYNGAFRLGWFHLLRVTILAPAGPFSSDTEAPVLLDIAPTITLIRLKIKQRNSPIQQVKSLSRIPTQKREIPVDKDLLSAPDKAFPPPIIYVCPFIIRHLARLSDNQLPAEPPTSVSS
jgi:hypothetical protein